MDRINLVRVYTHFLKEFYIAKNAYDRFIKEMSENSVMRLVMPVDWHHYDSRNAQKCFRNMEQKYAVSLNGKLGALYKAMRDGDIEKALPTRHVQE